MRRLSALDASFLALETPTTPMHIGGVSILEGSLDFETLRRHVASRIGTSRAFLERLADVPLDLGRPYWVRDETFDLDRHLERTVLPAPGGRRELEALVSHQIAEQLDRDRPLWHMLFVEGLDSLEGYPKGTVALITRMHHAAIDGVAGSEIVAALFDATPTPRRVAPLPPPAPERGPGPLEMLSRAGRDLVTKPELGSFAAGLVKGFAKTALQAPLRRAATPPLPFTAPETVFDEPVTAERAWSASPLSLAQIKRVRKRTGTTVNDVVLAICGGALRDYLLERGSLPEKPLVAMVPVSVREDEARSEGGNHVSAMLVSLATDRDDPLERLRAVSRSANGSKIYHRAVGARTLMDAASFLPFSVAGAAARLYSRFGLADRHRPIFNLVITNVPGPQHPLYLAGSRLLRQIGIAPIFDGIGLILPVFSYDGTLAIGACTCPSLLENARRDGIYGLVDRLQPALDALEAAVDASVGPSVEVQPRRSTR